MTAASGAVSPPTHTHTHTAAATATSQPPCGGRKGQGGHGRARSLPPSLPRLRPCPRPRRTMKRVIFQEAAAAYSSSALSGRANYLLLGLAAFQFPFLFWLGRLPA